MDGTEDLVSTEKLEQFTQSLTTVPPFMAHEENWTEVTGTDTCRSVFFRFVLYVCVFGVVCILGFIGNIVSFIVIRKDGSSPVASFQLQVLAVADNVLIFFWTNHFVVKYLLDYVGIAWVSLPRFFWFWRVYLYPVAFIAQTETIWLTVLIAVNRFIVVRMPLRAKYLCTIKNVYKQVIGVTVFSILYNLPRFFEAVPHEKYSSDDDVKKPRFYYRPTKLGLSEDYQVVYINVMYQLVTFAVPLVLLAFLNTSVMIAYRSALKRRRLMSSRSENENNITLVMIVVVLTFMICLAPARIVQLVWKYKYAGCSSQFYLLHASNILEASNSSINFILYFWLRKRFRTILWQTSCCGPSPEVPEVQRWLEDGYFRRSSQYSSLRKYSDDTTRLNSSTIKSLMNGSRKSSLPETSRTGSTKSIGDIVLNSEHEHFVPDLLKH